MNDLLPTSFIHSLAHVDRQPAARYHLVHMIAAPGVMYMYTIKEPAGRALLRSRTGIELYKTVT